MKKYGMHVSQRWITYTLTQDEAQEIFEKMATGDWQSVMDKHSIESQMIKLNGETIHTPDGDAVAAFLRVNPSTDYYALWVEA